MPDTIHNSVETRLADMPECRRNTYRRAMAGEGRKLAIRAMCIQCMGYESAEIERCTATACPLYPYRGSGKPVKSPQSIGGTVAASSGASGT